MASPTPNLIDTYVGARLRQRRIALGLAQEDLAARIGVSYQQVQKYERGHNRVSASRLHTLCRVLEVPVGYFFPDPGALTDLLPPSPAARAQAEALSDRFCRIIDPEVRRALSTIVRALAA